MQEGSLSIALAEFLPRELPVSLYLHRLPVFSIAQLRDNPKN